MVFQNIIVRMPNWVGDAVCASPILSSLRQAYPASQITAMCQDNIGALFAKDPAVNNVFRFCSTRSLLKAVWDRDVIVKLRAKKYDLGVLLTHSFSSAWRFWQGNVKKKVGFIKDGRRFLLSDPIVFPKKKEHMVHTYQRLLSSVGVVDQQARPRLFVTEEEKRQAWQFVKRFDISCAKTLIGINPGAAYGMAKCWLPERFRELARKLIESNPAYTVLFFGSLEQQLLVDQICKDLSPRVVNLAGQTSLRQLMAIIKCLAVLVTNDSGPMHIADSLNIPLVALFGSTDPAVTGPYFQRDAVVASVPSCSPCFKRVCPIDFRCMKAIQVNHVFDQVICKINTKV